MFDVGGSYVEKVEVCVVKAWCFGWVGVGKKCVEEGFGELRLRGIRGNFRGVLHEGVD